MCIRDSRAFAVLLAAALLAVALAMPLPFTRELYVTSPAMHGNDVTIMQNLIVRDASVTKYGLVPNGNYDASTAEVVSSFQVARGMPATGVFDDATADALLSCCSDDGITDTGFTAGSLGYKYKVYLPVHTNRSIETMATLFNADGKAMLSFRTRAHGYRDDGVARSWPDYSNDDGLNQFTSNGATPTGVVEIDLNSPEPNPDLYGPYPVNRVVRGLQGNAAFLLPYIRDGLLIHTGDWPGWTPDQDMPNSSGCMHTHPDDCKAVWETLVGLGVEVHENPFSGKNYPFQPQGVMVIEQVD